MFHFKNGFLQLAHSNVVDAVGVSLTAPKVEASDPPLRLRRLDPYAVILYDESIV
jgi:hypothetical protein